MKNLKKVVALVLVVAMMASFAVTAGAANFTDKASIKNTEAVEVMSAIGIIDGYADGSFKPEGTLTREQAAKIITYMKLGKTAADKLVATVAPYADVAANRWSAGAIAYCTNEGILAGVGNNKFNPTGELTGLQFAKMLLVALGYDPAIEGLTGSSWAVNTAKLALDAELDDDINGNLSTALSRQDAAQMAFNTLKADMVEYDATTNVNVNGAVVTVGNSKAKVQTTKKDWGKNIKNDGVEGVYTVQFAEKFLQDLKAKPETDAFGRDATKWTWKNDEIGTYSDDADYTFTDKASKKALYDAVGKSVVDDLLSSDTADAAAKLTVVVDGQTVVDGLKTSEAVGNYFEKKSTATIGDVAANQTGNGSKTEVYVNDDTNAVKIVIINTYLIQATDDYSSKKESVTTSTVGNVAAPVAAAELTLDADDFDVENVKEDDYLLITCAGANAANKEIKTVAPATVVNGNVETYANDKVTINGTTYKYAFKADTTDTHGKGTEYEIGEDAKVVTDGTYILYVDEATVSSDKFVYVTEIAREGNFSNSGNFVAKAYFLDGTEKTITLKDKYKGDAAVTAETVNTWFRYTESNNKYTLEKLTAGTSKNNTGYTTTSTTAAATLTENGKVSINGGAIKANAATIFVVIDDDDDVTAYTGVKNVPTIKNKKTSAAGVDPVVYSGIKATWVVGSTAGYAKYVFIDASDNASIDDATTASSDFIYMLKYDSTNKDADKNTYYTYKAIVNGEETKINLNDNFSADGDAYKYKLFTDVKYDSSKYVDRMNEVDSTDDYATVTLNNASISYNDGVLTLGKDAQGKDNDYVVDDKCNIYLIAADTNVKENSGETYEVSANISANTLNNYLKDYSGRIDGVAYAHVDDDTDTLVDLYVYVSNTNA